MATWPEPPFSSSYVGAWFAQLEAALELNHMDPGGHYVVLLDVVPLALQLYPGVPLPGPRPYDELRQSALNFYGAAYRPLPEVDHTIRDSSPPTPSRPAPSASAAPLACHRPQATSSPLLPPTITRDNGDIADPTPAPLPHAIVSVFNDIAPPTTTPDPSTPSTEPGSQPARELHTEPISLPPTLPAIATMDTGHYRHRGHPTSNGPYLQWSAQSSAQLAPVTPPTQPIRVFTCAASADVRASSLSASRPRPAPGFCDVAVPAALHPASGVLTKPPDTPVAPDPTLPAGP